MADKKIVEFTGTVVRQIWEDTSSGYRIFATDVNSDEISRLGLKRTPYGNVAIQGNLHELGVGLDYQIKAEETNGKNGYSYKVINISRNRPKNAEDMYLFLKEILTPEQARVMWEAYPDIVQRVIDGKTEDIDLSKTKLKDQIVVGVDLNTINHNAVCSAINYNGTVLSRKFINFGKEKDHLNNCIKHKNEAIKLNQPKQLYLDEPNYINYNKTPRLWRFINYANKEIAVLTARAIVDFAKSVNADIIVFEHLDTNKRKRFLKEKLHLWCAKTIQKITASLAHKNGIHIRTVFANGTSKYAFDGSGEVKRGKQASPDYPYNVCVFTTGKIYNSDLNASYNIAARYFIKEIEKAKPKKYMAAKAKDPSLAKRSTCTLDTLIRLAKVA